MTHPIVHRLAAVARRLVWGCLAALALAPGAALAHEGHEDPPGAAAPVAGIAPRVAAYTPDIELLAELRQDALLIYLDRFATNEPLGGATVEIEEGANRAAAVSVGEGLYQARATWLARPGKHALVFTVHAKDLDDLLSGTLEVSEPHSNGDRTNPHGFVVDWKIYTTVAALLLAAGAFVARRKRQRNIGRQA